MYSLPSSKLGRPDTGHIADVCQRILYRRRGRHIAGNIEHGSAVFEDAGGRKIAR